MNPGLAGPPLGVIWAPKARTELRAIPQPTALELLHCLDRYLSTGSGDIKKLKPPLEGFRLRCGEYRLIFNFHNQAILEIKSVRHRRDAYR